MKFTLGLDILITNVQCTKKAKKKKEKKKIQLFNLGNKFF